ncbi:ABC transporter ATP-binding protein [Deltaproteobacteria bacterium]|nr:ABC transporter ATP-binding protein [Deltaproteobacteria bacterium]
MALSGVSVTFSGARALDHVDFTLSEGEHVVVQGRNGSGKSTLLRVIHGEIWPDQRDGGGVCWFTPEGPEDFPLIGMRMSALVSTALLENYQSKGWRITGETLLLTGFSDSLLLYAEPSSEELQTVHALAGQFAVTHLLDKEVPALSHGQLRLLLLARACARNPAIFLLDEVTDGLDRRARRMVNEQLERLAASSTLLAVAHRPDTLPGCMLRSARMEQGKIIAWSPWSAVSVEKRGAAPLPEKPAADDAGCGLPLIDIVNADVFVDSVPVLHGINWQIRQGEQWLVVGCNGSGKSTLLRLIAGLENVAAGGHIERRLPGQGEGVIVELERMRRGIGLISEKDQAVYRYNLTGEELVLTGFERSVGLFHEPEQEHRDAARAWMERLEIAHLAARRMRSLSTGQLRRLFLARALAGNPDIVLLDEPCSGLDAESGKRFLSLVNDLALSGVHFVLVTHHENDVFPALTHIARLDHGRMVLRQPLTANPPTLFEGLHGDFA